MPLKASPYPLPPLRNHIPSLLNTRTHPPLSMPTLPSPASSPAAPRFIDLTHPLVHGAAAFPNDPKMAIIPHGRVATHSYNLSHVLMGTHQGTHLDAMYHFFDDGLTLEQMPLEWFYGP